MKYLALFRRQWSLPLLFLLFSSAITAAERNYARLEYWQGGEGLAPSAPEVAVVDSPVGPAVQATVQVEGRYQGLGLELPEDVDLSQVDAIEFDFFQDARPGMKGDGSLLLDYAEGNGLYINFKYGRMPWNHVSIPMDVRTLKSLSNQAPVTALGMARRLMFSLYGELKEPGQRIAVANLTFTPRRQASAPIHVAEYHYLAEPTSGDDLETTLTDGVVDKSAQAYWREYATDPDIVFDLGGLFLVDSATLATVAVPSQNIAGVSFQTSTDGEKWKTAAYLKNTNATGTETSYTIAGDGLEMVGRFVRVKINRSRTDFQVRLAEVSFCGRLPSEEELTAIARKNYDLGPELPPLDEENYLRIGDGKGGNLWLCRANGVACHWEKNGQVAVERLFQTYEQTVVNPVRADAYSDVVESIETTEDGAVVVRTTNPALPGYTFAATWKLAPERLIHTLAIETSATGRAPFYPSLQAVLPPEVREGGLYETWGAGHYLEHKFAEDVLFDYPADSTPALIFESPRAGWTFLHYRHRHDGRYVQLGSGELTLAGLGDKRSFFTATGWRLGEDLFVLGEDRPRGVVEDHLELAAGDVQQAYDAYLAQPEVKAFRDRIRRPEWLKDVRFSFVQEWDGLWGDHQRNRAGFLDSLVREGHIVLDNRDLCFHWGDFPVDGDIINEYGGRLTHDQLKGRLADIRQAAPKIKLGEYTWLWSASDTSDIYKEHPEWFIDKDAQGRPLSLFPGWGINYYRRIDQCHERVIKDITDFNRVFDLDFWYLDGGGSPACLDPVTLTMDEPDTWDSAYLEIREKLQRQKPDSAVFFNTPFNPIADFGYLENSSGVMTTNWRDGATWMYKFKLWQRADGRLAPLYIYWQGGVDQAFRQYAAGTGLGLTLGGDERDNRRDVAIMQAQQQSRPLRLVSAGIRPDWRHDPATQLEVMPLTFGTDGWLFVKNHAPEPYEGEVSADAAPLGLRPGLPVHRWRFTLKPHADHKGLLSEGELEDNYCNSRWASDFIITSDYLGEAPFAERLSLQVKVEPEQMQLLYYTQSPAVIYSVDDLRCQFWLADTLGCRIYDAETREGEMTFKVAAEGRRKVEVLCPLPPKTCPIQAIVDGTSQPVELVFHDGVPMALLAVTQFDCRVVLSYAAAPATAGAATIVARPGKPGGKLALEVGSATQMVVLAVEQGDDLVWTRNCQAPGVVEIPLPKSVTGGTYEAVARAMDGTELARTAFELAAGTPRIGRLVASPDVPYDHDAAPVAAGTSPVPGVTVRGVHREWQPACGTVKLDPAAGSIEVATLPMYHYHWNGLAGALDLDVPRYLKLRLSGNFGFFNRESLKPGRGGICPKYDNPSSALALVFDFDGADGRPARRVLAGVGLVNDTRQNPFPSTWGTAKSPDAIGVLSGLGAETIDEEEFWVDLKSLGVPEDWQGRMTMALLFNCVSANRRLTVQITDAAAMPPEDTELRPFFFVRGGAPAEIRTYQVPQEANAPKVDGVLEPEEWDQALVLEDFSLVGNPAKCPPTTRVLVQQCGDQLYFAAEIHEAHGNGFHRGLNPWTSDGLEIYLKSFHGEESFVQYIITADGETYAKWNASGKMGTEKRDLPTPEHVCRIDGEILFIETAIPLAALGERQGDQPVRFNLARNRQVDGISEHYSFVPGKVYLNFEGAELRLP